MTRGVLQERLLAACAVSALLGCLGVVLVMIWEAAGFFGQVPFGEVFGSVTWQPDGPAPQYGVWSLVSGTLLTVLIAVVIAIPTGLMAAIHLSEFASPRSRRVLKPLLEVLAGIPTIVYGVFAVLVVIPALRTVLPTLGPFNALGAGLVLGLMIIPVIASLADDALQAVPRGVREGALALGSRPLAAIRQVILPAAASGIGAGVLLAFARAVGETLIVSLAAGHRPTLGFDPTVPIETMTGYIVRAATGDAAPGSPAFDALFAVGAALFLVTAIVNSIGLSLTRRMTTSAQKGE